MLTRPRNGAGGTPSVTAGGVEVSCSTPSLLLSRVAMRSYRGESATRRSSDRPRPIVLLLFDIDGTLLEGTAPLVGEAMSAALREVHAIDTSAIRTYIPTAGRTDGEIARAILLDAGVPRRRIDGLADRVREVCCKACARLLPDDLSGAVLPGVRDLLDWLAEQDDVKVSLLTGNYEAIARLKLERAGIGHAFARGQGVHGLGCVRLLWVGRGFLGCLGNIRLLHHICLTVF